MFDAVCSLIVVNYNGVHRLKACFQSLLQLDYPPDKLDLILIDNGSTDGSLDYMKEHFPSVRCFVNSQNNYAGALNLGVGLAAGEYIGFLNNDLILDSGWLKSVVTVLDNNERAGAVGGKLLLPDGRINSVGIQELPDFYWQDLGFGEKDIGQYNSQMTVNGICWAAVLFRRLCLQDVGPVDDDFVMYFEDVEYSKRCQKLGWNFIYTPSAVAYHEFQGSSRGNMLTQYFCNRNRFLYLAKHEPSRLCQAINNSVFFTNQHYSLLFEALFFAIKKLLQCQSKATVDSVLPRLCDTMNVIYGRTRVEQVLARLQVIIGSRKPSICIYDHGLHFIGGGQKYVATLASVLQAKFDVTFIANKPVTIADLQSWYDLDLSLCKIKIVPLDFYEKRGLQSIDSSLITEEFDNPFDAVSQESRHYDIFINANQLEKVKPLAPISIFFCHFPNSFRGAYFAVDDYTFVIANSSFTIKWLQKRWDLEPIFLLYPPVAMTGAKVAKEKIILSVAQFEAGGTKKQLEMIEAFTSLCQEKAEAMAGWKLLLVGGSTTGNPYLKTVQNAIKKSGAPIEVKVNATAKEVQSFYAKSSIFWHLCGLAEVNPQRFEHFGMATVESMQNFCAPVVFNGGGQAEIIKNGESGLLFDSIQELCRHTNSLISNSELLEKIQAGAYQRSQDFSNSRFAAKVTDFFDILYQEYATIQLPNPSEVAKTISEL